MPMRAAVDSGRAMMGDDGCDGKDGGLIVNRSRSLIWEAYRRDKGKEEMKAVKK
jgi:hypothetical protein